MRLEHLRPSAGGGVAAREGRYRHLSLEALWLVNGDDLSRSPFLPRPGDDAGLESADRPAGGTVPVLPVYRGGVAVHGDAQAVRASAGGGLAGEVRRDVLGCHHGGAALAVGGMGFRDPWSSRSLFKTRSSFEADPAQWPGPGRLRRAAGPRKEARAERIAVVRHPRSIEVCAAGIKVLDGQSRTERLSHKGNTCQTN